MMKPNTRLLIRFTLPDGAMKSWGYDYPYYTSAEQLHDTIVTDLSDYPDHTAVHLFYDSYEDLITPTDANDVADTSIAWLKTYGVFS